MAGSRSLQDMFPDLFALAQHQNKTLVGCGHLKNGSCPLGSFDE